MRRPSAKASAPEEGPEGAPANRTLYASPVEPRGVPIERVRPVGSDTPPRIVPGPVSS